MGKLLSWVALIALAWLVFRLIAISQRRRERGRAGSPSAEAGAMRGDEQAAGRKVSGEMIVPCAHCGVFLPASDALRDGNDAYCSRAHRDAHREMQRERQPATQAHAQRPAPHGAPGRQGARDARDE